MKVVILAGGGGTRLFPLSRQGYPKQFLKIGDEVSLLAQTINRFQPVVAETDLVIVTNKEYLHHVQAELKTCGIEEAHIILEPVARNTAPAIALAARYCIDKIGVSENEVIFVTPADHVIRQPDDFCKSVHMAVDVAKQGKIVTFGIKPDKPETGYGYIQAGAPCGAGFVVDSFREKPDTETAIRYIQAGNYYWNSGMFAFRISCLQEELDAFSPEIATLAAKSWEVIIENFANMPSISIDYAIAEKSHKVVTIPLTTYWNDIGSWDAIYDVLAKDENGNAIEGDCLLVDSSNSLVLGQSRLIAGIGLEDLLVVETDDVILVAKKGESQKVKDVVCQLKQQGRSEAEVATTVHRPWGRYTVLGEGPGYKMKKIVVAPGERLSLQMHYHRSEHWIVTGGSAKVTIGEEIKMVHENESVFIPMSTKHRLENPGRIPLEIIEVQNGKYLEEDDIVRFDDIYGRA
ncbi:mannose-1-phosphate guanylyltransferase/mannose-6-phosphate isomerase [Anaerospora hongkongensis]|uniref:mannose-1-phosphate guanylyltransferase/mannose-6-phosphate isomerase n=1 Tax=Anaerospora hongkongensis TaxID=244830 RepID=UPI0028A23B66|nr:mannose-1-phosphate guanylyltransferase/mannose-6-phosphate isomerase [Anaerospora hongkongensis]